LKRLFAFYDSALHSLREGLILVDGSGRLVLYNDEAAALLGLPEPDESEPIALAEVALPESVRDLLPTGRVAVDEIHLTEGRVLVSSQKQASQPRSGGRGAGRADRGPGRCGRSGRLNGGRGDRGGRSGRGTGRGGTVATLRDRTYIQEL